MYSPFRTFSTALIVALSIASVASAQATRTWVSGVGDDANPCSRTAPCKTFAGAISKTAAGGEISVMDPGGFGSVTITKSMTITGDGTLAGILSAAANGIIVNAGPNDVVILRKLSINGALHSASPGIHGIRYLAGGSLVVENCTLTGFSQNAVDVSLSTDGAISLDDVKIAGGAAAGIRVFSTSGRVTATLNHVTITGAVNGVDSEYGMTTVNNSSIIGSSNIGVLSNGTSTVTVSNSLISANNVAVSAGPGSTIRLSNNDVYDNKTGFGCGGGTLASAGNNKKAGNTGGVLPVCAPTTTVTIQ